MKPKGVVRLLAGIRMKCTGPGCKDPMANSHEAKVHAAMTGHTVTEIRTYKLGVVAR